MVKPVAEGSSKGVVSKSVVQNEAELREVVREMVSKYQQPALVEEYIRGREFTVGLLGERRPRVLPPMEIVFVDTDGPEPGLQLPAQARLERSHPLRRAGQARAQPDREAPHRRARGASWRSGCRDVARIDFRMDARRPLLLPRVQPAARADPGLERPGAHRPGRGHGLPDAHRRDPERRHPPLQGARSSRARRRRTVAPRRRTGTGAGSIRAELAGPELREGKG